MDIQEQDITNRKCRDIGVQGCLSIHKGVPSLPALAGKACAELVSSSSKVRRLRLMPKIHPRGYRQQEAPTPNLTHPEYPVTPEGGARRYQQPLKVMDGWRAAIDWKNGGYDVTRLSSAECPTLGHCEPGMGCPGTATAPLVRAGRMPSGLLQCPGNRICLEGVLCYVGLPRLNKQQQNLHSHVLLIHANFHKRYSIIFIHKPVATCRLTGFTEVHAKKVIRSKPFSEEISNMRPITVYMLELDGVERSHYFQIEKHDTRLRLG
ncbi:hypothetical protein J6590_042956 [Homalodisca vitripennis]|nr:hypothetical protein J6590_042956 [Homalodisca vitripennis]